MSSGAPVKNGQQVSSLLTAVPLLSEIADIKIEAHTKRIKPEQGKAPTGFCAKAAAEFVKTVAHVGDTYSASAKKSPHSQTFAILASL